MDFKIKKRPQRKPVVASAPSPVLVRLFWPDSCATVVDKAEQLVKDVLKQIFLSLALAKQAI